MSTRGAALGAIGLAFLLSAARVGAARAPAEPADWRTAVRNFAAEHFKQPAWGYSHSVRDYALARSLAAADHVKLDDDVLFAASFLHDIAAFPPWENEKLDHSDVGADVVVKILKDTGFPPSKIGAVQGCSSGRREILPLPQVDVEAQTQYLVSHCGVRHMCWA